MPPSIHKWNHPYAILSTVAFPHKNILFAGTHDSKILCLDLSTYNLVKTIRLGDEEGTHTKSSVLCVTKSQDECYLFTAGADSLVRIWSVDQLTPSGDIGVVEVATMYSLMDIGDIFSLRYLDKSQTVVLGCQNANMLYMSGILDRLSQEAQSQDLNRLPHRRYDRFFDSTGPGSQASSLNQPIEHTRTSVNHTIMEIPLNNIIIYAHNSFIYCIDLLPTDEGKLPSNFYPEDPCAKDTEFIVSSGGDGISKVWAFSKRTENTIDVNLIAQMDNEGSVLCQVVEFPFLYCGLNDGYVKIWDLNLKELVSVLRAPSGYDIVSVTVHEDHILAASQEGITEFYKNEVNEWDIEHGLILSTELLHKEHNGYSHLRLVTGAKCGCLSLWNINELGCQGLNNETAPQEAQDQSALISKLWPNRQPLLDNDSMLETLRELVNFKTVSASSENQYIIDSRRCASYLQQCFTKLGAVCELLPISGNNNPLVHARFNGSSSAKSKIVWYGHYDIITAGDASKWETDPYTLTCENGYLKGRGVTDNKGPLVAAMYSVGSLFLEGALENDVIFLVEGQEESNSQGFVEAIKQHRSLIGDNVDWILFSNSYWIDEKIPCLNYGLRGVINSRVTCWSDAPDRHSGLDGGVDREPTTDLVRVLSALQDDEGNVVIPGFYSSVKEPDTEEKEHFNEVLKRADTCKSLPLEKLLAKWIKPSLSVTNVKVSGPGNATVIPHSASATISIRIVPDQDVKEVQVSLERFLVEKFGKLKTSNHLKFELLNDAEPWLGDPKNTAYKIFAEEVQRAWGVDPLLVREGGSIPQVRFLERALSAPAVQIPCGQSSDNAHLDNERLRIENWYKMREIMKQALNRL
ncbi:LADA_0E01178g1_1 [Lachancea dasiensis]|uniref:LADA_0E01178g1_1 n=1 Tax=Lachancea dasiensis TaxID=1072105 RepID=A0A1G4JAF5_9SACH|nr:LADA_0E01178g1_1 [Lachancea dasiensis]